jgi:hypothetical protein
MCKLKDIHVTKRISTRATRYCAYMGNIKNQSGITVWRLHTWNITNGSATNLEHNWGFEGQVISKFHD